MGVYDIPNLLLTNPNRTEIALIPQNGFTNLKYTPRFNALSELSFKIYNKITLNNKLVDNPNYDLVRKKRLIYVDDLGINVKHKDEWFEISEANEAIEGDVSYKDVQCFSYEYSLNAKPVNLLSGTYKFYDEIDNSNTLLGKIVQACPSWSIGEIDPDLWGKYRTFDIPNAKIYGFLMSDVEKAYECIFTFNTKTMKINATAVKNVVKNTDIILTFDNLIKHVKIDENADDIITGLGVFGSGDLDIRNVNPLGTAVIYNFNYYKTTEWMSQGLIDALNVWEGLVESNTATYTSNLATLKQYNSELLGLKTNLINLQGQLKAAEVVRSNIMTLDMNNPEHQTAYSNVSAQINALNFSIATKQNEITDKQTQINSVQTVLSGIRTALSFSSNFTQDQLLELDKYITIGHYQNENYVQTDEMTPAQIQDMSSELLAQGRNALNRLSQPMYTFSMDSMNFLFIEKFKPFADQIELGCLINAEIKPNEWAYPILLEMSIDYDDPSKFTMTFGNRFRLDKSEWTFSDLYDSNNSTTTFVNSYGDMMTKPIKSGMVDKVSAYMNDSLNLSKQMIVNAENQNFTIRADGINGTKQNEDGTVDPHQVKITNNIIAMTDDNWATLKLALGVVNGKSSIIADVIAGKLLAGNDLLITNDANNFRVDHDGLNFTQGDELSTFSFHVGKDGVSMVNGSIVLENSKNKIIINPDNGFKMQQKEGEIWVDKLYADENGNLVLKGRIETTSGTIGGFKIGATTITSANDNLILDSTGKISVISNGTSVSMLARTDYPVIYGGNESGELFSILHNGTETLFTGQDGDMIIDCPNGDITLFGFNGINLQGKEITLTPGVQSKWHGVHIATGEYSNGYLCVGKALYGDLETDACVYIKPQMDGTTITELQVDVYDSNGSLIGTGTVGGGTGGLPTGGTTGQVLGKISDADNDVGWINQTGGGGGDVVTKKVKSVIELTNGFQLVLEDNTVVNYNMTIISPTEFKLADNAGFETHFTMLP